MAKPLPKFKDELTRDPRNGWNYTVGDHVIESDSFEGLLKACREYAKLQGISTKGLKQDITLHICEENPWMCQWVQAQEKSQSETKPRNNLNDFVDWLQTNIITHTDYETAKQRTNRCLKCPYNQRVGTLNMRDRKFWSKYPPHIKLYYCTHHHHDNAVAVHLANIDSPNGTPPQYEKCWMPSPDFTATNK